jgi:hypothetical protein
MANVDWFVAAAETTRSALDKGSGTLEAGAAGLDALPRELGDLSAIQPLLQVMPVADLAFGGAVLLVIMLIHATGIRTVSNYVRRATIRILARPASWRADVLMSCAVFLLLALHVLEIFVWAAALVVGGLAPDWRVAGLFAGNTYTTLGYDAYVLPRGWGMVAPLVAISGLFTFGWSGSVLVDLVRRCQKIKDATNPDDLKDA